MISREELKDKIHDEYANIWSPFAKVVDSYGGEIITVDKSDDLFITTVEYITNLIIADRKKIVEPLVNLAWHEGKLMDTIDNIDKGVLETIKNAGVNI